MELKDMGAVLVERQDKEGIHSMELKGHGGRVQGGTLAHQRIHSMELKVVLPPVLPWGTAVRIHSMELKGIV